MSRGAIGANESNLTANLRVLRNAIDLFQTEHEGTYPAVATIDTQLTQYTDISGTVSATKTGAYIYGPYIRSIPPLPVGAKKGKSGIAAADGGTIGWIYDASTGVIKANCPDAEVDSKGVKYNTY
jgi:hypothetical protein